jgi:Flp pilus assembly protein TadD
MCNVIPARSSPTTALVPEKSRTDSSRPTVAFAPPAELIPSRTSLRPLFRRVLSIALCLLTVCALHAETPCAPPLSMKAQLQDKPKASTFTDLGVWFADQHQYACAANAFATSLQMAPSQPDVGHIAFMLGVSLYLSGDTKEAITSFQESEQLGYHDIKLHIILAKIFDSSGSTKDAEGEWRAALDLDPESSDALDALSSDLLIDNDYKSVIALLENSRVLPQRTPQQALNLAAACIATSKADEAASELHDALETSPDSLPIAFRLADILVQLHRTGEAITVLELAHERHPESSDAAIRYLQTLIAAHSGQATDVAPKLLLAFPGSATLLYLNGVLELQRDDLEQAHAHLQQATTLQPDDAQSHALLGVVLAQQKELPAAKAEFQRAITLGDTDPEVKQDLAKVERALGAGK